MEKKLFRFKIRKPYWGERGISVDLDKCQDEEFEVECTYKNADGSKYFDGVYVVKRHIVKMMKSVYARNGMKSLKLIKFEYLKSLKEGGQL